jgi:hypothetical protein
MNLRIHIKTIPHKDHRYETVGDWFYDRKGVLQIRVSAIRDSDYELAVALHEVIEAALCNCLNVTEAEVDHFDKNFKGDGEPGDDPKAPYHRQHVTASICERAIAQCLEIDWNDYTKAIDSL